jgi:hypothetical protein
MGDGGGRGGEQLFCVGGREKSLSYRITGLEFANTITVKKKLQEPSSFTFSGGVILLQGTPQLTLLCNDSDLSR